MARSALPSRRSTGPARRKRIWIRSDHEESGQTSTVGLDLFAVLRSARGTIPLGITVGAIRMTVSYNLTSTAEIATRGLAIGVRVATAPGPTTPLSPLSSSGAHEDWMAYRWHPVSLDGANTTSASFDLDVKSMRKIDEHSQSLFAFWVPTGATSAEVKIVSSVLILLP